MVLPIIEVRDASFAYGDHEALHCLSAQWPIGVSAVLGPNGAGKTTLLRLLCGLAPPSSGVVLVGETALTGASARSRHRAAIGYLPQEPRWDVGFTVAQFLTYFAFLRGVGAKRTDQAVRTTLEAVDLVNQAGTRLKALSGGQRRRVYLAQTLVHDPPVLILDEPTAGLDPVQRVRLRQLVGRIGQDRTVILATHLVEDAVSLDANTLVLSEGSAVWTGPATALAEAAGPPVAGQGPGAALPAELGLINLLGGTASETE